MQFASSHQLPRKPIHGWLCSTIIRNNGPSSVPRIQLNLQGVSLSLVSATYGTCFRSRAFLLVPASLWSRTFSAQEFSLFLSSTCFMVMYLMLRVRCLTRDSRRRTSRAAPRRPMMNAHIQFNCRACMIDSIIFD